MRFVDVNVMVLQFLSQRLDVPVYTKVPKDRDAAFIVVRRNGGAADNRVLDVATVTVDAWAGSDAEASVLAEDARSLFFHESSSMPLVRGVEEITGPYSTPDPESGSPRFRFTMQLGVRAKR